MSQFTFRTTPPATYISPTADEMREVGKRVGLAKYSKDLVADLCNLAAGGSVTPPSGYRDQVTRRVEEQLPAPDSDGKWQIPEQVRSLFGGKYNTKDRYEATQAAAAKAMKYHANVCDFLGSLDLSRFPGETPLEQAMACLKLLSKKGGGQAGDGDGEPLPIFSEDKAAPEQVAKDLHDAMETVESMTDEEKQMLDPDQKLNKLEVAEKMLSDERLIIDISRKLDSFTKLQVRKQEKLEQDPAGEEVRTRPIQHIGELSRVAKSAWAMRQTNSTFFLYQAVTHQLPVRERVTRITRKQAIFVLVDGSGSMSGRRHLKATGVVMNRLKAVLSGDAEVFLTVFDTSMGKVDRASTPEEAKKLIEKFRKGNFSGGGTDIAAAVKAAHKHIEKLMAEGAALYRPEVVVLTDDDPSAQVKQAEIPGTRVHGFAMECSNPSLVAMTKATGGVGIDNF